MERLQIERHIEIICSVWTFLIIFLLVIYFMLGNDFIRDLYLCSP